MPAGSYNQLKIIPALDGEAPSSASNSAAPAAANDGVTVPTPTPSTAASLDEFLKQGGHVLGYAQVPDDPAAQQKFVDQSTAWVGAHPVGAIQYKVFEAAAMMAPGEPFLAHIDVAHEKISHPENLNSAAILNRLEAWSQAGVIRHEHGTFYSSQIEDVLAEPQSGLRYRLGDLQTPLDAAKSGAGDCKTSAMERYALLQQLAARGKINAGPGDVFLLEVVSRDPHETMGHTVAGYFDRGRQALLIFDGDGYQKPRPGQQPKTDAAYLYEDTQKGRRALGDSRFDVISLQSNIPVALQTHDKSYSFDVFQTQPGKDGKPQLKIPHYAPGKDDPVAQMIPAGPIDVVPTYKDIIGPVPPHAPSHRGPTQRAAVPN